MLGMEPPVHKRLNFTDTLQLDKTHVQLMVQLRRLQLASSAVTVTAPRGTRKCLLNSLDVTQLQLQVGRQ